MNHSIGAGLIATALFASACNGAETGASNASGGTTGSSAVIGSSGQVPSNPGMSASSPGAGGSGAGSGGPAAMPEQTCNADVIQWAIGQAATTDMVERLRRESGAKVARVLKPGLSVTQEFMFGRLNVNVDQNNVITQLSCW